MPTSHLHRIWQDRAGPLDRCGPGATTRCSPASSLAEASWTLSRWEDLDPRSSRGNRSWDQALASALFGLSNPAFKYRRRRLPGTSFSPALAGDHEGLREAWEYPSPLSEPMGWVVGSCCGGHRQLGAGLGGEGR